MPRPCDSFLAMTGVGTGHLFADAVALGWLGSQPIESVNASAAHRVARTWRWNPLRAGRRRPAWRTADYIQKLGNPPLL
jgi:hypothetical protein